MAAPWQHVACCSFGTCMTTQRRSYDTGHKPKCLVIVDDTAEWDRGVHYASRWARGEPNAAPDPPPARATAFAALPPGGVTRGGNPTEQVIDVIEKDVDI